MFCFFDVHEMCMCVYALQVHQYFGLLTVHYSLQNTPLILLHTIKLTQGELNKVSSFQP